MPKKYFLPTSTTSTDGDLNVRYDHFLKYSCSLRSAFVNSLVSASYPCTTLIQLALSPASPKLAHSRPSLALLQLIFGQVASPHFSSASPQFHSSCDTASSQFGSSSAQLRLSLAHFSSTMVHAHWIAMKVCCIGQTPFAIDKAAAQLHDLTFLVVPLTKTDIDVDTSTITTLHPHPLGYP